MVILGYYSNEEGTQYINYATVCEGKEYLTDGETVWSTSDGIGRFLTQLNLHQVSHLPNRDSMMEVLQENYPHSDLTNYMQRIVGEISFETSRGIGEVIQYTDGQKYLKTVQDEIEYRATSGFSYKTFSYNPELRKSIDDIVFDLYGERNPNDLNYYKEKYGSRIDSKKGVKGNEQSTQVEMKESFMAISENLAGKLWDEECRMYMREGNNSHMINSRSELYEAGKEKTLYVREEEFLGCMKKEFFPTVTCEWSEHDCFDDGKTYLVSEFSDKMANADQEWCKNNRGGEENAMGYAKVKFQVNLSAEGDKIVERQDIGGGDGSMIEFLRETGGIQYQRAVEQLEEACTLEKDFMNYQKKLNGIFEQKEGHLPHPKHTIGNCQDEILNTIQKKLNRDRSRQRDSKPANRHLERLK